MKELKNSEIIYESGIRDRGAFSYVIICFWVSLFLPIIVSLMGISKEELSFELFWKLYTTVGLYSIMGGVPLLLLIGSFGLYSCKLYKSKIVKKHLIYFWKNQNINVINIKWIEFQPIFAKGGYDCFKIYHMNGNSFYIEVGKEKVQLKLFEIFNQYEKTVYIREKAYNRFIQSSHDLVKKRLVEKGIKFNDERYHEFISEYPKFKRAIQ